jgi:hypothetical protein
MAEFKFAGAFTPSNYDLVSDGARFPLPIPRQNRYSSGQPESPGIAIMSLHEAPSSQKPAVWLPFSCPSCRGLFRSLSDQEGVTQCPLCEAQLAIQVPNDVSAYRPENPLHHRPEERLSGESADWGSHEKPPKREKKKRFILVGCAVLTLAVFIALALLLLPSGEPSTDTMASTPRESSSQQPLVEVSNDDLEAAFEVAERFLEASTIEDLAPLIRKPDSVMPKVREFYRDKEYTPPNFKNVDRASSAEALARFVSFPVIMPDYSTKPIAVEFTSEGPKIDWPSWVGYCEVPWQDFVARKVTTPTLVRVRVASMPYYNFDFSSEEDWRAFRLLHPDSDTPLYGYAASDASFLKKLPRTNTSTTFTLKIHYPENPRTDDQVIISDFISEGWLPDAGN